MPASLDEMEYFRIAIEVAFRSAKALKTKMKMNENESLLIPAVQHDIYPHINCKIKIDLRLT